MIEKRIHNSFPKAHCSLRFVGYEVVEKSKPLNLHFQHEELQTNIFQQNRRLILKILIVSSLSLRPGQGSIYHHFSSFLFQREFLISFCKHLNTLISSCKHFQGPQFQILKKVTEKGSRMEIIINTYCSGLVPSRELSKQLKREEGAGERRELAQLFYELEQQWIEKALKT